MSGINLSTADGDGSRKSAAGIAAWQSIKTTISTAWVAMGGSLENLAFIFEMSQPYSFTYQSILILGIKIEKLESEKQILGLIIMRVMATVLAW